MRIAKLVTSFFLLTAGLFLIGAGPGGYSVEGPVPCNNYEDEDCSEIRVTGHSQGNHELDCTVIQPWSKDADPNPRDVPYSIIGWANGWNFGNVVGEFTTEGYKPGLIEWALDGPYIVVAANQWSVRESDVLACVEYVINDYEHKASVIGSKIGLAGHSQGGGAIIKAGDGEPNGFDITATIAMNPYGPAWVKSGKQDGPLMLLGGTNDTTTPTSSFDKVWQAIQSNGIGGLHAELQGGTHNDDAWAPEGENPEDNNFGRYQEVTELWWQIYLNDNGNLGDLESLLGTGPDVWEWSITDGF